MMAKRLFFSGLLVMCVFAIGHLAGFLAAAQAARNDPGMAALTQAMREHKISLLGFQPSILDFREYFSLNFSILLLLAAGLGFVVLRSASSQQPVVLQQMSVVYAVGMLMLAGSSALFSVVQGIIGCMVLAILFGLCWWLA